MIKKIETIPTTSDNRLYKIEYFDKDTSMSYILKARHVDQCHGCDKKQMCDKIQDSLKEAVTYDGYFCIL